MSCCPPPHFREKLLPPLVDGERRGQIVPRVSTATGFNSSRAFCQLPKLDTWPKVRWGSCQKVSADGFSSRKARL